VKLLKKELSYVALMWMPWGPFYTWNLPSAGFVCGNNCSSGSSSWSCL